MRFVINTTHRGPVPVRGGRASRRRTLANRRRVVHLPSCRYAGQARIIYSLGAAEVERLLRRKLRGDDDGRTVSCAYCAPARSLGMLTDAT